MDSLKVAYNSLHSKPLSFRLSMKIVFQMLHHIIVRKKYLFTFQASKFYFSMGKL